MEFELIFTVCMALFLGVVALMSLELFIERHHAFIRILPLRFFRSFCTRHPGLLDRDCSFYCCFSRDDFKVHK